MKGKNKKAQSLGISIITSFVILIVSLTLLNFLHPEIDRARDSLNCSSADTISDGVKILCLSIGTSSIYWVLIMFSLIIGGITGNIVSGRAARLVT